MGIFNKTEKRKPGPACPACGGQNLGLGYVDRVRSTVLHGCKDCGLRWRDDLIDLADAELAARAGG